MTKQSLVASMIEAYVILLLVVTHCLGSVVVLVRDPDGTLTGGVDSLATDTSQSGEFIRTWQRCKVLRHDNCLVLMSGILSGPGVDVAGVMNRACASSPDARKIASAFFHSASSEIEAAAPPAALLKFPMVAAVIAPNRKTRRAEAAIVDFRNGVPRRLSGQDRIILYFGVTTALDSFSRTHPKFIVRRSADQVVRRYLQVAADAHPAAVGGQFSIFQIGPHEGFRWIDAGPCPDE
jgi:hypothetical protein